MSQIFHPSTNTISRVSIFGGLFLVAGFVGLLFGIDRSPLVTREGVTIAQPVPFSHDHHVAQVGIDCRYCHTTVETSSFAGMPPTATCMNCHNEIWKDSPMLEPVRASFRDNEPIRWSRVYDLPDYVYFDHSIHVTNGIGCASCHGRVDQMPLMQKAVSLKMEWCVDCHRDPTPHVRPKEELFNMAWDPASLDDAQRHDLLVEYGIAPRISCSACHR